MANFPHKYISNSKATSNSLLTTKSDDAPELTVSPPLQFNGPGGNWTPEAFFSAAISSCFILTFKGYARAKKLEWRELEVDVEANLDKTSEGLKFTDVTIRPKLTICCEKSVDPFLEALKRSEQMCLVTNSMNCNFHLEPKIIVKAK